MNINSNGRSALTMKTITRIVIAVAISFLVIGCSSTSKYLAATSTVSRDSQGIQKFPAVGPLLIPDGRTDVCPGLFEYSGTVGDDTYYKCTGAGCVWIYLTDCNGTADASLQYQCVPGVTFKVTGCHTFACSCSGQQTASVAGKLYLFDKGIPTALSFGPPCGGNACGDVSVSHEGSGWVVRNNGSKRVRVIITWMAVLFGQCNQPSTYDLNPGDSASSGNYAVCGTVQANYL